jgi:MSHA biogenesis protein MshL
MLLSACGTHLPPSDESGRHLTPEEPLASPGIPQVVTPLPLVVPPQPQEEPELYTVVAQDQPVRQVLFALARDSALNIDVNPDVTGVVSLNAIDQTLPQILERIGRQVDMRWHIDDFGNIVVEADSPYWKTYRIDYVNIERTSETEAAISTNIVGRVSGGAGGGGGGEGGGNNSSQSTLSQTSANNFWATLNTNLLALMGNGTEEDSADAVVSNPETGVVSIRATSRQHDSVAAFLSDVQTRSLHQVLIEATVVEVRLSDEYQAGVDWETLARDSGTISFSQSITSSDLDNPPTSILTIDRRNTPDAIAATVSLLSQFGESRVLSSPKIMALNNQSAMLRVVENAVYFTVEAETGVATDGVQAVPVFTTSPQTVPIGFSMTVTPQVSDDDQVTLNVRPTISRILGYVDDPNPIFVDGPPNRIPQTQVREFESILKVFNGQTAILGGLMEDTLTTASTGLPVLSRLPGVRNLFSYRDDNAVKTELIIFIRPTVVRQPSLQGDLQDYGRYLPTNGLDSTATILPEGTLFLPGGE